MSAKSKIVYPYPVYFPNTEDYENYLFDIGCNVDQSETKVTFHFCVEIYDEEILDLIKKIGREFFAG
ncbi:MAG: hypothetical protein IJI14_16680 [Anaerolineaceae bacterium]|nr:hypothetical protein [Anaerolineaceae bacterium]